MEPTLATSRDSSASLGSAAGSMFSSQAMLIPNAPESSPKEVAAALDPTVISSGSVSKVVLEFQKLLDEISVFSGKLTLQSNVFKVSKYFYSATEIFPDWDNQAMEFDSLKTKVNKNIKLLGDRISKINRNFEMESRVWELIEGRWSTKKWEIGMKAVGIKHRISEIESVLTARRPAAKKQSSYWDYVVAIPSALGAIPAAIPQYVSTMPVVGPYLYPVPPKREKAGNPPTGQPKEIKPIGQQLPLTDELFAKLDESIVDICVLRDEVEVEATGLHPDYDKEIALKLYVNAKQRLASIEKSYKQYKATCDAVAKDQETVKIEFGNIVKPSYEPAVAETVKAKWNLLEATKKEIEELLAKIKSKFADIAARESTCKVGQEADEKKAIDINHLKSVVLLWGQIMTDMRYQHSDEALEAYMQHYYTLKRSLGDEIGKAQAAKNLIVAGLKGGTDKILANREILDAVAKEVESKLEQVRKNLDENKELAKPPLALAASAEGNVKQLNNMLEKANPTESA